MELLVVLLVVLTIVTVVGHGIWVFLAFLLRTALREPAAKADRRCLYCNRPTPVNHPRCIWCQRSLVDDAARELADVSAGHRALVRLRKAGLITAEQRDALIGQLEEYRAQLLASPPAAVPPVAAVPEPPASVVEPPPVPVATDPAPVAVVAQPAPTASLEPPVPPAPVEPRKSWQEMLREFMEPHNIRWGELVGGLLFIIGAAALVITQWETLDRFRYFRFLALAVTNFGVFGAGLYAQNRWRLPSTSRALLTLAMLLVPLNFLALAGLAKDDPPLVSLAIDLVALSVFSVFAVVGGRRLVPGGHWWQLGSVMGLSLVVLLAARWFSPGSAGWLLTGAGCASVGIFAGATGGYLKATGRGRMSPARALGVFQLMGTAGFALAVALGLLAYRGVQPGTLSLVLDQLSIPLVLAAVSPLVAGLSIARRIPDRVRLEAYRTGGNWMALVAGLLMLTALGLAWPWPGLMTPVGLFAALALGTAAWVFRMPALHAGAIAAITSAYLMGFYGLIGATAGVDRADMSHHLGRLLVSARTGTALVGLSVALSGLAFLFSRRGRAADGLAYAAGAGVLALASLTSVSTAWPLDPWRAAIVYAIYATACLLLCAHFRRPGLTYAGLGLAMAAVGWGLWARIGAIDIQWAAALAGCGLAMSAVAAAIRRGSKLVVQPAGIWSSTDLATAFRGPLAHVADFVASGALVLGIGMAWLDQTQIDRSPMPVLAVLALTAHWLLTAWGRRQPIRTVLASLVALAGLVHTLVFNYTGLVGHPWHTALLTHAGLAVFGAGLLAWATSTIRGGRRRLVGWVFVEPLCDTGIVSSLVGLVLLAGLGNLPATLSVGLATLAAIWLVLAVVRRSPWWMALHQLALAAAVGFGAYAWHVRLPADHWATVHLQHTHLVGAALALLALAWVALRMAVGAQSLLRGLLRPGWPMPDQLLKHGLVVVQLAYLVYCSSVGHLVPGAWAVWGLLVAAVVLSLWQRWTELELADAVLLAGSLAWLAAGAVGHDPANVAALSWAGAVCCLAMAVVSWARRPLGQACTAAKMRLAVGPVGSDVTFGLSLVFAGLMVEWFPSLPVTLALRPTTSAVARSLIGLPPVVLYLVPLGLLVTALVGNALRERGAGHLFLAGLVIDWMVVLGQLVYFGGVPRGEARSVGLLQWPTIAAALWGMGWLAAAQRFEWLHVRLAPWAGRLFRLQTALGYAGNAPSWLLGVSGLVMVGRVASPTTAAIGSPLGWTAFLLALAVGVAQHAAARRWVSAHAVGVAGMAAVGLAACTVQGLWPDAEWGYRVLMLGWAALAWLIAAGSWWVIAGRTLPGTRGAPETLIRATSTWVRTAALAAVLLALKTSPFYDQQLWAAGAIAVASAAGATMAIGRRREQWAFASTVGTNVAASLVVWHFHSQLVFPEWLILMVQANALASAVGALVWIAVRRRVYGVESLRLGGSPLLAAQVLLPILANLGLLGQFLFGMAADTRLAGLAALQLSQPVGWAALVVTAAAAAWYVAHIAPARRFEVVGGLVLGLATLATAASFRGMAVGPFGPIYTLQVLLASAALLLVCLGRVGGGRLFFAPDVRAWVGLMGLMAIGYAVRWFPADTARPWIETWTAVCVASAFGLTAYWHQRPAYVWTSGLAVNLAVGLGWIAWGPWTLAGFVDVQAGALAVAATAWLLVDAATGRVPTLLVAGQRWAFGHIGLRVAIGLLATTIGVSLAIQIAPPGDALLMAGFRMSEPVHAIALALAAAATVISVWDPRARFALGGLYAIGLSALGLALAAPGLASINIPVDGVLLVAGFTLAAALVACALPGLAGVARGLRIPDEGDRWSTAWFSPAQVLLGMTAATAATWVAIDFRFHGIAPEWLYGLPARMTGPVAASLLVPMGCSMALVAGRRRLSFLSLEEDRQGWQELTLLGVALAPACWGWAGLDPGITAPWLHRAAVLVVDLAAAVVLCGYLLPRALAAASDWRPVTNRVAGWLLVAAAPTIVILLGLEAHHYTPDGVWIAWPVIAAPVGALAVLAGACIGFALRERNDPLQLGRYAGCYVYAAEILVALVGVHLRLTWPELFRLGIIERSGLLLTMALAFGLAGLSECFDRRQLAVLSEPLQRTALVLPLLPTIAFWLLSPQPAMVWFLIGMLYALMAVMRRSILLCVLAGLASNVGLWVLWHRMDLGILDHPQLWLIPPALAALVAEHFSRARLPSDQANALRYLSLGVIYVSSSADMFIAGVGNSVVLPLVLLSLSVLGILAGMALRIRSFLYLGMAFLLVVLAALLKHVTIDLHQTWVLWLSVGALGAAILALFAVFEKRRANILAAVERFRGWQR